MRETSRGSKSHGTKAKAALVLLLTAGLALCALPALAEPAAASLNDADMAAQLKQKIAQEPDLCHAETDISVRGGVAWLFGIVLMDVDLNRFAQAALEVPGVIAVADFLNHGTIIPQERDAQIERTIQHQLVMTPFGSTSGVNLSVKDGVAYLDGAVASWRGNASAEDAAYAGGAISVVNRLKIQGAALPYSSLRAAVKDQIIQGR